MKNIILNNKNKKEIQNYLRKVIEIGLEFKCQERFRTNILEKEKYNELLKFPDESKDIAELLEYFKLSILPYCSNFSSINFMGFPDSGNSMSGMVGAILSDLLQQNLINSSFCSPIATFLEIAVIRWLRELVGYHNNDTIKDIFQVGGIITNGGTGSNATALLLARENHRINTMNEGVKNPTEYKVIVPKGIGHYSIRSSLMWLGCGNNIIEVPINEFKYNLKELKRAIRRNKGSIMAVIIYVGDSRTMTIDNIEQICEIVKNEDDNIWIHADACHGFSLAFSSKLKHFIKGINNVDSISTDPHKVLMLPYTLSALLIKDAEKMKLISSNSDLIMQEPFAFGQITPFIGSKSWDSLKLWFLIKNIGIKEIGKIIDRRYNMALFLEKILNASEDFIVINNVKINSVMFMYIRNKKNIEYNIEELNYINKKIKEIIDKEGIYYLHQFSILDNIGKLKKNATIYPLRYMSGNDNIKRDDIIKMVRYVRNIAKRVIKFYLEEKRK